MNWLKSLCLVALCVVSFSIVGCESGGDDENTPDSATEVAKPTKPTDSTNDKPDTPDNPVLAGEIGIVISGFPARGQDFNVTGFVSGVDPSNYAVAMYINVYGQWWIKPYAGTPINIKSNGGWSADMITGGSDSSASQIVVYLVPKTDTIPQLLGAASLPAGFNNKYKSDKKFR